ncbi:MAG: DUF4430 domain-containing protein [Eubacteriales bacterium]|nr:DUF4430 domain-containing protein [Eubacteriales bacterium]
MKKQEEKQEKKEREGFRKRIKRAGWSLTHKRAFRYIAVLLVLVLITAGILSQLRIQPADQGSRNKTTVVDQTGNTSASGASSKNSASGKDSGSSGEKKSSKAASEDKAGKQEKSDSGKDAGTENSNSKASSEKNASKSGSSSESSSSWNSGSGNSSSQSAVSSSSSRSEIHVALEIQCKNVAGSNISKLRNQEDRDRVSAHGSEILNVSLTMKQGQTVYDALVQAAQARNIEFGARGTAYGMYVYEIDYLAEKDASAYSGWMYSVNGVVPNIGCAGYTLKDGDRIVWFYVS